MPRDLSKHLKVQLDLGIDLVSLGDGRWLPRRFWATLDDPSAPAVARFEILVERDCVPRVRMVTFEGRDAQQGLHNSDLSAPLVSIARQGAARAVILGQQEPRGTAQSEVRIWREPFTGARPGGHASLVLNRELKRRGRTFLTDQKLSEAADVYRRALRDGQAPVRAVAEALRMPHATAKRWIYDARKRGILGPTEERQAGERPPKGRKKR